MFCRKHPHSDIDIRKDFFVGGIVPLVGFDIFADSWHIEDNDAAFSSHVFPCLKSSFYRRLGTRDRVIDIGASIEQSIQGR